MQVIFTTTRYFYSRKKIGTRSKLISSRSRKDQLFRFRFNIERNSIHFTINTHVTHVVVDRPVVMYSKVNPIVRQRKIITL